MRKLTFISAGLNGLTCELKSDRMTIGREDGNDFKVPDGLVSSQHCEVLLVNGEVMVRDLNSTNGTFIDGKRVTEGVLRPGQVLRFAEVEARLDVDEGKPERRRGAATEGTKGKEGNGPKAYCRGCGAALEGYVCRACGRAQWRQIFFFLALGLGLVSAGTLVCGPGFWRWCCNSIGGAIVWVSCALVIRGLTWSSRTRWDVVIPNLVLGLGLICVAVWMWKGTGLWFWTLAILGAYFTFLGIINRRADGDSRAASTQFKGKTMHRCLTCAKEFAFEAAEYRCVNTKCVEKDDKLSEFMLGFDQVLGTVIPPNGSYKSADVRCHKCSTPTNIRLCPHCHGELPTYLDGVAGHTVYILGPKGCGKSLYLVATFEHLEKRVFPSRLKSHFEFCTRYTKERYKKLRDRVYRSGVLLDATRAERTDPELVLPFMFNANVRSYVPFFYPLSRNRAVNIAAFDTSGEDCEKLEALQWCCQGLPRSSALIILVDPTAFASIASQLPLEAKTSIVEQVGNAKTVIDNVTQFYRASRKMGVNDKVPIPTAFVLTKVDALKTLFDPASRIFQEAEHRRGYDRDYCEQVSRDVKSFLRDERIGGDNIVTAAETGFSDHLFFAATSLGKPPRVEAGHKLADNINPKNPENPWLWILHRLGLLSEA